MPNQPVQQTTTVADVNNGLAFGGIFTTVGDEIWQQGIPFLTISQHNQNKNKVLNQVLAFCQLARRMYIVTPVIRSRPPHIFLTLSPDEISSSDTVCTVEVRRADGKVARFALTLSSDGRGKVRGSLSAQRQNDDPTRELTGTFVDWDSVGRTPSDEE